MFPRVVSHITPSQQHLFFGNIFLQFHILNYNLLQLCACNTVIMEGNVWRPMCVAVPRVIKELTVVCVSLLIHTERSQQ